jgi:hypothetical protein
MALQRNSSFSLFDFMRFRNCNFYEARLSAPRPTPNLEGQGIPFCLSSPLTCLAWEALPIVRYRRHGSQDNLTMQVPPLRQSRDNHEVEIQNMQQ